MPDLIPLEPGFLNRRPQFDIIARLQRIVGSVTIAVAPEEGGFRVLGPAVPYHAHDPWLAAGLTRLQHDLRLDQAASYRRRCAAYDLCLEDSWSGYFVAEWLATSPPDADIVFIHLDHHTDMMPLLLERRDECLVDSTDGRSFDVHSAEDWARAIATGGVGIGTFVTTLFYLRHRLHVRHINNYPTSHYAIYDVRRATQCYAEIRGKQFAAVRKTLPGANPAAGTYRGGCDPARVLADIPSGKVIVHIDLDYLINEFNGNPMPDGWSPNDRDRDVAARKLDTFLDALMRIPARVERWIVATSPGFCSAYHWSWLLERVEHAIERVSAVHARGHA